MPAICSVCMHPNLVAIDTAIAAGTPPIRDVARQNPPLSKDAIHRHSKNCVTVKASPADAKRNKLATVARQQIQAGTKAAIATVAQSQLERSLAHDQQLDDVWDKVLADLYDSSGQVRRIVEVTDDGREVVRVDLLEQLLALSKARVEARGGGSLKWATLAAQIQGELKPATTAVQVNLIEHPDTQQLLETIATALRPYPDALGAVRAALGGLAERA